MEKILPFFFVFLSFLAATAQENKTENLIIVTLDGYRWREVFFGADEKILSKKKYVKDTWVQERFWDKSMKKRRSLLMPFMWNTIAKEGQLYGNRRQGNVMRCTNGNLYSYSGYSEMFVGFVDPRVRDNTPVTNPNYTVLEFLNNHTEEYRNKVAIFSTWSVIPSIFREKESGLLINSGSDKALAENISPYEQELNKLTDSITNPYGERYDRFTFGYAFEFLKRERPRVMFISLDETDEHGHGQRYDMYLKSAHEADSLIGKLWSWIQSDSMYKDKTTLMITTDHGRGGSPRGFQRHALLFRESSLIWLAVIGPDTPATGEMKLQERYGQNQIAGTIAELLEVPYHNVKPIGKPIPTVIDRRTPQTVETAQIE